MAVQERFSGKRVVSGLFLACLGFGVVVVSGVKRAIAETPPPALEHGLVNAEAAKANGASKSAAPPSAAAILIDPALYRPTLPSLGDAPVYFPSEADILGTKLVVSLSQRRVLVYKNKRVVASYPIAIGKPGWETPLGEHQVFNMEENPIFKSFKSGRIIYPGPDNPLGIRWIGIWTDGKTQLGFHGTNEPELIGQAVSHGCIRMHNKDVVALYKQVKIGTPVEVKP